LRGESRFKSSDKREQDEMIEAIDSDHRSKKTRYHGKDGIDTEDNMV
jgi:hypothetical protein